MELAHKRLLVCHNLFVVLVSYLLLFILHLSLQYFTSPQTFSHFLRQVKGFLQTKHIRWGNYSFLMFFKFHSL